MTTAETTYAPPPVTGYRTLTQSQIDLMNKVKALGPQIQSVIDDVKAHVNLIRSRTEVKTPDGEPTDENWEAVMLLQAEPERWAAMARSDLQVGLMKLTRAVAQPAFF